MIAYPYLDAGRDRLAAGFVLELRPDTDPDELATSIIGHPAANGLLYMAHDGNRLLVVVGDDHHASELAGAHAAYGTARYASGRVRADHGSRATGELVDRLLSG